MKLHSVFILFVLQCALVFVFPSKALAHSTSTSYFMAERSGDVFEGEWAVRLEELVQVFDVSVPSGDASVKLDINSDGDITWNELQTHYSLFIQYASDHIRSEQDISSGCVLQWQTPELKTFQDDLFLSMGFTSPCRITALAIDPVFDVDSSHRIIATLRTARGSQTNNSDAGNEVVRILSPQKTTLSLTSIESPNIVGEFLWQGVVHILVGYDHLLFLMALVAPILFLFARQSQNVSRSAQSKQDIRSELIWPLMRLITAFTVGHSVTLALATLGGISLPAVWVESVIAVSVVVAGVNVLWPLFKKREWLVALVFGLIHGFGFANVLGELLVSSASRAHALLSFNIGVELGQLGVVLVIAPIVLWLARKDIVNQLLENITGIISILIGSIWVWQRLA